MRRAGLLALLLLPLAAACDHSDPFTTEPPDAGGPFEPGPIAQVTYNVGDDRTAAWLPDGSGFIYSTERVDRRDHDRCLAVQPSGGGTVSRLACHRVPAYDDTTDVWESPAVNERGELLYLRVVSRIGRQKRDEATIVLADAETPAAGTEVVALPYTAEDGRLHSGAADIRWVGPGHFVYLAQRLIYEGSTFLPDTFLTGVAIMEVRLDGGAPVRRQVPNTLWASSVSAADDGDTIYYTLGGDSRVYRQSLASGAHEVVHDFGAGRVARGAQVVGNRLVAVVDGSVLFRDEGVLEMVQRDEGGVLWTVDLATGAARALAGGGERLFHRPVLSPDGSRVVAEGAPFAEVHSVPDSEFNAVNHRHDLWHFILP